jgi:kynurenine formamidase
MYANKSVVLLILIIKLIQSKQLIDLTHSISEETIYWPTGSPFNYTEKVAVNTSSGFFYSANEFKTPEHLGTHIDAPYHFCETCMTIDKLPIENFICNGFIVDISDKCNKNRNYLLSVDDFKLTPKDFLSLRGRKNILLIR